MQARRLPPGGFVLHLPDGCFWKGLPDTLMNFT
jgi:hypothetical protein